MEISRSLEVGSRDREPRDFRDVELAVITTREKQIHPNRYEGFFDDIKDETKQIFWKIKYLRDLLVNPELTERPDAVKIKEKIEWIISVLESGLLSTDSEKVGDLKDSLATFFPGARVEEVSAESVGLEEKIESLVDFLDRSEKKCIVTSSDSHRTTGVVLKILADKLAWAEKDGSTAVLAFDRHIDTGQWSGEASDITKANVFVPILEEDIIGELAVVGAHSNNQLPAIEIAGKVSVLYNKDLYVDRLPKSELFLEKINDVFLSWKAKGIKRIYFSVDIDGLRIMDLGYTATDYNMLSLLRKELFSFLNRPSKIEGIDDFEINIPEHPGLEDPHKKNKKYRKQILDNSHEPFNFKFTNLAEITSNYGGVPAKWVGFAMKLAKEHGLEVGLKNKKGQVVVGDVVEREKGDYKGRTTKITAALLKEMIKYGQSESP